MITIVLLILNVISGVVVSGDRSMWGRVTSGLSWFTAGALFTSILYAI